ncbi:MAG: D-glycerate dehydrogenase [Candidatus Cloacimonetes bacterium]|nr:D-glycerate dehydrogenase [Candidatus Cloacimonadota bacterium]
MKPIIFISRRLPEAMMEKLADYFEICCNPQNRNLDHAELLAGAQKCDVMITMLADSIDREILASNPRLKGVCNYAVGYNNIDVAAATELGIPVCNTPGVLTETTADLAWALLMSAARRIVESDRFTRAGKFTGWAPCLLLGEDIYGKTLGIIGAGRIGEAVARRSCGFSMHILYTSHNRNEYLENDLQAQKVELAELLQKSDFISLHVPYNEQTHHLIGKEELAMMKKTAVLINTARGQVIDESALIKALKEYQIAAAGLDVFYSEPEIPQEMRDLENIVIVPHIGSASLETRTRMAQLALDCARACIEHTMPPAIVNPEVLKN